MISVRPEVPWDACVLSRSRPKLRDGFRRDRTVGQRPAVSALARSSSSPFGVLFEEVRDGFHGTW